MLIDLYSNDQLDYLKYLQHTQNVNSFYDLAKEIMNTLAVTRKEHREKQREIERRHKRESSIELASENKKKDPENI